jgi:iron complex transport system permease protein
VSTVATRTISTDIRPVTLAGRIRGRPGVIALIGLALLAVLIVAGVTVGSTQIDAADSIGVILHRVFGLDLGLRWTQATETIVWELRLPRVLTAALVGAGLAVAGATFQGIVRNPLADPYVLGASSGAALGAALAILLPVGVTVFQFGLVNVWAFIGALGAALLVFRLGGSGGSGGMTRLLLTGYAVGSILAALLTMAMYVSGTNLRAIFSFLLGGLAAASWERLIVATPLILGACLVIGLRTRSLDGLLLGDDAAAHLGVDVKRERGILLVLATMATAAAVAITGLIGFVGLVVPHVVRLLTGASARRVVPISAIFGAILLSAADLVARMLGDLPVGVVMAIIGAPFFLVLLYQTRTGYEL